MRFFTKDISARKFEKLGEPIIDILTKRYVDISGFRKEYSKLHNLITILEPEARVSLRFFRRFYSDFVNLEEKELLQVVSVFKQMKEHQEDIEKLLLQIEKNLIKLESLGSEALTDDNFFEKKGAAEQLSIPLAELSDAMKRLSDYEDIFEVQLKEIQAKEEKSLRSVASEEKSFEGLKVKK